LLDLFRVTCYGIHMNFAPCYTIYAMTNPSCTPNISFLVDQATRGLALFLHDGIRTGEELCFSYTKSVACMTTAERQKYFSVGGGIDAFICRCATCTAPDPIRRLSGLRRSVMRYLLYLVTGHDLLDVPAKIHRLTKDKSGSKLYHWHVQLYGLLAKAEKVERLAKELLQFDLLRQPMFSGP
jgi:hypothetical protein